MSYVVIEGQSGVDKKQSLDKIRQHIDKFMPEIVAIRHDIHSHPELAYEEVRTSDLVADLLTKWGYKVTRGLGKTGLVGQLKVGNGHKRIGLRADMDALPIIEETGLPYASKYDGKMHACGHDGHTASLLAAARYLAETKNFSGTVNLIFQPAEEGMAGAEAMINDGLFEQFPCDAVFGFHNMPHVEEGKFGFKSGAAMASSDTVTITIKGRGGHGSMPFNTIDPIAAGCALVTALQTIVSRNIDPREMAVVTVGAFHAGTASNIIPETAELLLTVRAFNPQVRELLRDRICEMAKAQAASFGAEVDILYEWRYPPLINYEKETNYAANIAAELFGEENIIRDLPPTTGSEDFSFMLEKCPGTYLMIGSGKGPSLHNSKYDFDDKLLPLASTYWGALVEDFLKVE